LTEIQYYNVNFLSKLVTIAKNQPKSDKLIRFSVKCNSFQSIQPLKQKIHIQMGNQLASDFRELAFK